MDKPAEVVAIRYLPEFVIGAAVVNEGTGAEGHLVAEAVFDGWGNEA